MTKVAAAGQLPMSNALHFGLGPDGGGVSKKISTTTLKRKTPSELRSELLQRKKPVELVDESQSVVGFMRKADEMFSGPKKDSSKASRFTRMDEHFPVSKTSRLLCRKKNSEGAVPSNCLEKLETSFCVDLNAKSQVQNSCLDDSVASKGCCNTSDQTNSTTEKCTYSTFKSVRDLSLGGEKLNGFSPMDMGKALRGLVSCEPHTTSAPEVENMHKTGSIVPQSFCSVLHIPNEKILLDLTLKTNMRLLCSSSVHWFHKQTNCATPNIMGLFSQVVCESQSTTCSSDPHSKNQVTNAGTFHSWVHPQSSLPNAVISALSTAPGGQMDFLSKRQQAWEDSFRSLYYMLRKKYCKIFYVCTVQFVVMFTAMEGPHKIKCNAYISQSTRNLRSLLKEHGVSFSMPLCHSKVEEVTAEDLVELSEIEKHNLGQTRAMESLFGVDGTPESLLMCTGNKNVHGLYDFLLNYRSFFTSLTGEDVPVLYSPVPFENAALSSPEVRCKQVRRVDGMPSQLKASNTDIKQGSSSSGICYSIEIKDAYLPPWIISGICDAVRANGSEFQASFVTEPTSTGLNVGLNSMTKDQLVQPAELDESSNCFAITNTTLSLQKHSAFLKGLKYGDGSYTAFLSRVE